MSGEQWRTARRRRPAVDLSDLERDEPGTHGAAGPENRVAAFFLAALLGVGAALGSLNLLVDGVLRPGPFRPLYAASMLVLLAVGVVLALRQRVSAGTTATLVVVGDVVYVIVSASVTEPLLFAPPLMLLFCCAAAAWFLGPRMVAVHMVLVVVACVSALSRSYPDTAALVVQVAVNSAVLDLVTLGVFLLRRRVQRLLTHTQALSSTDPLTGLANRRSLVEQAPRIWRQARRDGQRVAALVLDLDHFKRLNDAFGHAVGDAVLRAVATALGATVRPADVLARTGGEEPTDALWRLVDRADAAMYEAKQHGRDRVVLAGAAVVPFPRMAGGPTAQSAGGMA
jgi:GGDEF domain-containing protein